MGHDDVASALTAHPVLVARLKFRSSSYSTKRGCSRENDRAQWETYCDVCCSCRNSTNSYFDVRFESRNNFLAVINKSNARLVSLDCLFAFNQTATGLLPTDTMRDDNVIKTAARKFSRFMNRCIPCVFSSSNTGERSFNHDLALSQTFLVASK